MARFIDRAIERCTADHARPQLDRSIEQHPDDVPLLALVLAHEQLVAARRGTPSDAAKRIARLVLAQLAQAVTVTGERSGPPLHGRAPAAPTPRRVQELARRPRQHRDAERIGEGEWHLEEPRPAFELERQPVDGVPAHALAAHEELHEQARAARNLAGSLVDPHAKLRRMRGAQAGETRGTPVAIAKLGDELDLFTAGDAGPALVALPRHLEAGGANAGHVELRHQARDREPEQQRAARRHRRGVAHDQPERHTEQGGARERHAARGGVGLHGPKLPCD